MSIGRDQVRALSTCGYQLCSARSQERYEQRAARRPVLCHARHRGVVRRPDDRPKLQQVDLGQGPLRDAVGVVRQRLVAHHRVMAVLQLVPEEGLEPGPMLLRRPR